MSESNLIEKVKNSTNIVDVISEFIPLIKKGKNYKALCPFHEDSNPSMSISEEKQIFNCFSCNTGGNAISFYSKYKKISFRSALEHLAKKYNIEFNSNHLPQKIYNDNTQKLIDILNKTALYYQNELYSKNGINCLKYLVERKITNESISHHKIGYSALNDDLLSFLLKDFEKSDLISAGVLTQNEKIFFSDRLMFPIMNGYGDIVGFSGRTLNNNKMKYINSYESKVFIKSSLLYNYYNAKEYIMKNKEVYITEGYFDVIALEKLGIMNVVALMGTALTNNHIALLKGLKVILILDSDSAGIASIKKSVKLLLKNQITTYIIINNENLDPDEYFKKYGKDKTMELIKNQRDAFLFLIKDYKKMNNISNPLILGDILKELSFMIPKSNHKIYSIYKNEIQKLYGISKEIVDQSFDFNRNYHQSNVISKTNNEIKDSNKTHNSKINYFNILKWTLLSDDNYCKLYLELNPLMSTEETLFLKDIAKNKKNNIKIINDEKIKFLKDNNNKPPEIIKDKNLFYDIIEKLSIESLENLEKHLLLELQDLNHDNITLIKNKWAVLKSIKNKLRILKKERKDGKN